MAAIMGLSPWASPWSVWADKVGLVERPEESGAMRLGKLLEPVLVQMFHDHTGLYVAGEQMQCEHPDKPWMRCTLDGLVIEGPSGVLVVDQEISGEQMQRLREAWIARKGDPLLLQGAAMWTFDPTSALAVYEAKYTSEPKWDEVPPHYACQVQWQMAVTGQERAMLGVLHMPFGRPDYQVYTVERDDTDIKLITDRCEAFWHDHVLTGIAPPTDAHRATSEALGAAWHPEDESAVEASVGMVAVIERLHTLNAQSAEIDAEMDELENRIKARLGEHTALTAGVDGKGKPRVLCTWKPQVRRSVDTVALRADMPDVADKYTRTTETRSLRLKTNKENH